MKRPHHLIRQPQSGIGAQPAGRSAGRWASIVAGIALVFACCAPERSHQKHRFFSMDTMIDVTVVTRRGAGDLGPVWASIDSLCADWNVRFADTGAGSEIARCNARTSPVCAISAELGDMLSDALRYGDTTRGMFDITILPLKDVWGLGFANRTERVPSPESLAAACRRIDYRSVRLNAGRDSVMFSRPDIVLDAGGFAKGYALIKIGDLLHRRGFTDYLVVSGDIVAAGQRADGKPWRIGIQHPRLPDGQLLASVPLRTGSIFTSGDYERHWESDPLVHHIFNPRTCRSCTANQSLTIWAPTPVEAKFLSTGLFGFPADSILAFVGRRTLQALVVDSLGKVHVSPGWVHDITFIIPR